MVPEPASAPVLPRRALCDMHMHRAEESCRRCQTAAEITGWWEHKQGRCDPGLCPHCAFEAGPRYE